jgi:hypothetical protein
MSAMGRNRLFMVMECGPKNDDKVVTDGIEDEVQREFHLLSALSSVVNGVYDFS